jgi:hypothetical protein
MGTVFSILWTGAGMSGIGLIDTTRRMGEDALIPHDDNDLDFGSESAINCLYGYFVTK